VGKINIYRNPVSTVPEVTVKKERKKKRHGKKKHMKMRTKVETYIAAAISESGTANFFLAFFPIWQE
jgi:hypothetical protein